MDEIDGEVMSLPDELKLDYIKNMRADDYRYRTVDIISSMKSEDLKIQALPFLKGDYNKYTIIMTLKSDEKKIEAMKLSRLKGSYLYKKIIKTFSSTEKKIQAMRLLSHENDQRDIILTLDEKIRMSLLGEIESPQTQDEILSSITDDSIKLRYLHDISDENLKCRVLRSLKSDVEKLIQLQQLKIEDEYNLAIVIASLKSDKAKLEKLGQMTDSRNIALIKMSLTDREKLKETFLDESRMYSEIGLDENMTIGMEIESEGPMSWEILNLKKIAPKQVDGKIRGWESKDDESLYEGVEVVAPILTDNKEDVEDIYMVCSMLQKCGNYTNERCGGHIHIGADYLKSKEAYVNLFEIWGNAEKIIIQMSNETGTIPRMSLEAYAAPISAVLDKAIKNGSINLEGEEDLDQFIGEIQKAQTRRHFGLNLLNINNGKNTIEFRISNGTINPDVWIENARLYGRIVQVSQKLAEIEKQPQKSKEDERLLDLKSRLKEEIPEQEKMGILLELLFSEEERKVYRERYISSSKLLEQIPAEESPFEETEFSRVDFKKKKHSLEEFHDVAVNSSIEAINEITKETIQGVRTEGTLEQDEDKNMEERI